MNKATLTILLMALTAAIALGAGNNWRNERQITSGASNIGKAAIATSGGNAVALFERGGFVKFAVSNNGGVSWGSEAALANAPELYWNNNSFSNRPLAVILNGTTIEAVYAGNQTQGGGTPGIWYERSTDLGQTWTEITQVGNVINPGNVFNWIPSVSITRCGTNVTEVAWTFAYDDGATTYIKHRRKYNGVWQTEQVLASYNVWTGLHVDIDGRPNPDIPNNYATFVVWNNPVDGDIYYRKSTNQGSSWQNTTILEDNSGTSSYPAVKLNSSLQGFALWENGGGVRSKRITGPASVTATDGSEPRLAIDETDSLFMARTSPTTPYRVKAAKSADGYTWTDLGFIQFDPNSPNANLRHPDVSWAHTDGTMRLFLWNGVVQSLNHQELWLGVNDLGKPAAPLNFQAVQYCPGPPFGYWTQLTWLPTPAWDDSGYNIYRGTWTGPSPCQNIVKLNGDIYLYTSYTDYTIDCGCYCYEVKSKDLALNEGPPTPNLKVGPCTSPGSGAAEPLINQTLGGVQASPYTVRRGGRLLANGNAADIDSSRLAYHLSGLDPQKYYALTLLYVFPGMSGESRTVTAWADTFLLDGPTTLGNDLAWSNHVLPRASYAGGTLNFSVEKVDGPGAVLAWFILWKMPDGFQGGPQSVGLSARNQVQPFLAPPRPNPSTGEVFLGYWLPRAGEARLRIYNTAGQLVREVDSGQKAAGTHNLTWDGKNASGHKVPNGIYLVRLVSGSVSATQKATILR